MANNYIQVVLVRYVSNHSALATTKMLVEAPPFTRTFERGDIVKIDGVTAEMEVIGSFVTEPDSMELKLLCAVLGDVTPDRLRRIRSYSVRHDFPVTYDDEQADKEANDGDV